MGVRPFINRALTVIYRWKERRVVPGCQAPPSTIPASVSVTPLVTHRSSGLGNEARRTVLRCIGAMLAIVAIGTIGFAIIEQGWTLWKSLYFTLITITTVGYGDQGISPNGEKFASLVLIVGMATTTYCMGSLIQVAVSYQFAWKSKMQHQINDLRAHVIVCGFGRMGKTVCSRLRDESVPLVVVEQTDRAFQEAIDSGYLAVVGNATEDDVLLRAGIDHARAVVCVVNSDAENVFITLSARAQNNDAFIACRADGEGASEKIERAGASLVVSPHYSAGIHVATAILRPNLAEFLRTNGHAGQDFEMSEVTVGAGSPLAGKSVAEFGKQESSIVFVAVKRSGGQTIIRPGGSMVFEIGDVVIVAGERQALVRMEQESVCLAV